MLGLFINPEDGGYIFLEKSWITFNGVRNIMFHKTQIFTPYLMITLTFIIQHFKMKQCSGGQS
jgi:hypothetical protein